MCTLNPTVMVSGESVAFENRYMRNAELLDGFIVRTAIVAMVLMVSVLSPACSLAAGPWKGQVVDGETRKPLEGVVVLALWFKRYPGLHGPTIGQYYDSEEILTDADGRFKIASRWTLNPFVSYDEPELYLLKSGYGRWQFRDYDKYSKDTFEQQKQIRAEWEQLAGSGVVLELPKLKTRKEMLESLDRPLHVPFERMPKYMDAYNRERVRLGLDPIPSK
jgi:hypothetical protein